MIPTIYYCYDAYCGWCYGFSPVMTKIALQYQDKLSIEVLSGGMMIAEAPQPISTIAPYIQNAYKTVESKTGIRFGPDFLWHIFHPEESDWFPDSLKSAIALCVFKDYHPSIQTQFASDLQFALNYEGRDLCDDEAYRHLLTKYAIPEDEFYSKLGSAAYANKAFEEFELVKRLKVNGFPTLMLQATDAKFFVVSNGYSGYNEVSSRLNEILECIADSNE